MQGSSNGDCDYMVLRLRSGRAYIRADKIGALKAIDAFIFDCDGVLVDIRESYDRAISKTAAKIFEHLTGRGIPEELLSDDIIFLFRRSGGFNNDWDIVYGALMFLLCELPERTLRELSEIMDQLKHIRGAAERLSAIAERTRTYMKESDAILLDLNNAVAELRDFTALLDSTGAASVDRAILGSGRAPGDLYGILRDFLLGSGRVGESIIATAFEEIFCGPSLFEEAYGIKPGIYFGPGMIENERLIVRRETLERLSSMSGGRLGIASGSRRFSAKYVLGDILLLFNPKAQIFLDDIEAAEAECAKMGLRISLKKPNPYPLLESAKGLEPFNLALYVGDSMEDAIMVKEALRNNSRFLFAGVYEFSGARDKILEEFLKFGCDLIIPSVNDIPEIMEALRGVRD
ncbi:MAG: hypothetical protein QXR59_00810 [Candidatus Bathyarchaeia archaeon]